MNISIITTYFPPQNSAGANRLASFARGFRDAGWTVAIYAARFGGDPALTEQDSDLTVLTKWKDVPQQHKNQGFVKRFFAEWQTASDLYREARNRPDGITVISTPFLSMLLLAPRQLGKGRWVADVRDLTWNYRISRSILLRIAQKCLGFFSLRALSRASLIVTSTASEKAYLQHHLPHQWIEHVANGVERRVLEELSSVASANGAVRAPAAPLVILYAGTVGKAQKVSVLVDVARMLPSVKIKIIGDGAEIAAISDRVRAEDIRNVDLAGRIPRADVFDAYRSADVLFLRLGAGFETAVPSKAYEYLATGKPVIYMGAPSDAAWQLLREFKGVYFLQDDDVAGFKTIMEELDSAAGRKVGRDVAKLLFYTRENQVEIFSDHLRRLESVSCVR